MVVEETEVGVEDNVMKLNAKVNSLMSSHLFDEALDLLSRNRGLYEGNPKLLTSLAICIMMSDDYADYSLEDAKDALIEAISVDPLSVDSLMELAYYYLNIQGDVQMAKEVFLQVEELCRSFLDKAAQGIEQCKPAT